MIKRLVYFAPREFTQSPVRIDRQLPSGRILSILIKKVCIENQPLDEKLSPFARRDPVDNNSVPLKISLSLGIKEDCHGNSPRYAPLERIEITVRFPKDSIRNAWSEVLYLKAALLKHIVMEPNQLRILSQGGIAIVTVRGTPIVKITGTTLEAIPPAQ